MGPMIRLDCVDSTNAYALSHAGELAGGTAVVADRQEAGRGRGGREWLSPGGCNLYLTILEKPPWGAVEPAQLTLVAALAVHRTAMGCGVRKVWIKWPNDVFAGGRKLAGVLAESGISGGGEVIAVGIGVNVNMALERLRQVDRPATSVAVEVGGAVDRERFLNDLVGAWTGLVAVARREGVMALHHLVAAADGLTGRRLRVAVGDDALEGVACGIDPSGGLRVQTETGPVTVAGGEIVHILEMEERP